MNNTISILQYRGYFKIPFRIRKSNHLYINAKINGIKKLFLLDTGASSSCIDIHQQSHFKLKSIPTDTKASGAGSNNLYTEISKDNRIGLGKWKSKKTNLVLLDLTHVNIALSQFNLPEVQGIIGSDLLKKHQAIIDYSSKNLFIL